jgi:two-component system phosphate regulon response regulator OmpR
MNSPQRILVADDDPEIRKLLARYIEGQGFSVLLAASCHELHERLATHQVDLVVLDVMLPDGSGLDVCRDLRAQRSNVPIILLAFPASEEKVYRFEGFTADPQTRRVIDPQGTDIVLTGAEFDLLKTFLDRPGRVLSRDQLLDLTRGRNGDVFDRSIDVLVSRLRRKLGDRASAPLFKTVRNGGYQLAVRVDLQDGAT